MSPAGMSVTSGKGFHLPCSLLCPRDQYSPENLGPKGRWGREGGKELAAKHPRPEDAAGSHQAQTFFRNLLSLASPFQNGEGLTGQLEAEDRHLLTLFAET